MVLKAPAIFVWKSIRNFMCCLTKSMSRPELPYDIIYKLAKVYCTHITLFLTSKAYLSCVSVFRRAYVEKHLRRALYYSANKRSYYFQGPGADYASLYAPNFLLNKEEIESVFGFAKNTQQWHSYFCHRCSGNLGVFSVYDGRLYFVVYIEKYTLNIFSCEKHPRYMDARKLQDTMQASDFEEKKCAVL